MSNSKRILRLHVWGPAFGLASIDAECLAAITYAVYALPAATDPAREKRHDQRNDKAWELVATSPSAVPTHALPALHDTASGAWITGFHPIVRYLSSLDPRWDLDSHLHTGSSSQDEQQRADLTAYTAFLQTTAPPLLALSLFVSSTNWAATTRPAFSSLLPFPLAWTEPPALRNRMCDVAAHLGLSDLNIDAAGEKTAHKKDDTGFLKIPERLRPRPSSAVKAALSPEQTALFRLEAAAGDGCLSVLEHLKQQGEIDGRRFFFAPDQPMSLDCLAFAYLSLMLVPDVPCTWLRDLIRRRFECLSLFVDGIRDEAYGGDVRESLPWHSPSSDSSPSSPWRLTRFVRGVMTAVVPGEYLMAREKNRSQKSAVSSNQKLFRALVNCLTNASIVGGVGAGGWFMYQRHMLAQIGPFVYRWETQRSRFGAAGAFFGI